MIITVKQLYEWAKSKGYENFDLGCTIHDIAYNDDIETYPGVCGENIEDNIKIVPEDNDLFLQIYVRY